MYKRATDPKVSEVNEILNEGYSLFSITPLIYGQGFTPKLVYHFIKEKQYYIGVDLCKNNDIGYPPPDLI